MRSTRPWAFMGAHETFDRWVAEIKAARGYVLIIAFTFDLFQVVDALTEARRRLGPEVRAIFDKNMLNSNQTRNQRPAAIQLRANGVKIRTGPSGRVHAKVLLTDSTIMLGSTNWAAASQQNEEWSVAIEPTLAGARASRDRFEKHWGASNELIA